MWASQRHALEMNGDWPERAMQTLAAETLNAEGLKMPPDLKIAAAAHWLVSGIIRHCVGQAKAEPI